MTGEFEKYARQLEVVSPDEVLERYNHHPVALLQTYEYFTQPGPLGQQAKAEFLQADAEGHRPDSPNFSYAKLDLSQLLMWRDDLAQMLEDVSRTDLSDEANRLIRENITTRLAEVGVMILTRLQTDTDPNEPEFSLISWQLKENMREIYGAPQIEEFQTVLGSRLSSLVGVLGQADLPDEIAKAADYIRKELPDNLPDSVIYKPNPETIEWYAEQLQERCAASILAVKSAVYEGIICLNEDNKLDCENIIKATQLVLKVRGYDGWEVKATTNTNIDTSQADTAIYIPKTRLMSLEEFNKVIVGHEVDEHVGRRINGDETGVAILGGLGCTDYLQWEEGNGKANEALMSGKASLQSSAFGFFLTGGLIMGLDREDGKGRNFGETFDMVWRLNLLEQFAKGKVDGDINAVTSKIKDKAFDDIRRLFRGTDGKVPGVFYPKDSMTYYLGQVDVWRKWDRDMRELDDASRRREHQLERSAKINPLRPDHHRVVDKILST